LALRPQVTSERFTILFATPSLNDGKSNRSADKSMSVRNSCRQVIARHPGTFGFFGIKKFVRVFSISE
jgi:hypothetical protein